MIKVILYSFITCFFLPLNLSAATFAIKGRSAEDLKLKQAYADHIAEGIRFFDKGDCDKALEAFWKAVYLLPDEPDAYINIAGVYIKMGDFDLAINFLANIQRSTPDDYPKKNVILYDLGVCFQGKGNYSKAIEFYYQAVKNNPYLGEAMFRVGKAYSNMGQKEKAFVAFYKAREIFYATGDRDNLQASEKELAGILKDYDGDINIVADKLRIKGEEYFLAGQVNEAVDFLQDSIFLNPGLPKAHYKLGVVYFSNGNLADAIDSLNFAVKLDPDLQEAYLEKGKVYVKLGDQKNALAAFKQALELNSKNPHVYYHMGLMYLSFGNEKKAKKYFMKARVLCEQQKNYLLLNDINKAFPQ